MSERDAWEAARQIADCPPAPTDQRSARARGRTGGRPHVKGLAGPRQLALAKKLYAAKEASVADLCRLFKVSRATFYRSVAPTDAAPQTDTER